MGPVNDDDVLQAHDRDLREVRSVEHRAEIWVSRDDIVRVLFLLQQEAIPDCPEAANRYKHLAEQLERLRFLR